MYLPRFDVPHAKATGGKMKMITLTSKKWVKIGVNMKLPIMLKYCFRLFLV